MSSSVAEPAGVRDDALGGNVVTLVMKVEYNGFRYAGFQRQTATNETNRNSNMNNTSCTSKLSKRKRANRDSCCSTSSSINPTTTPVFPNTIQHQLETAIQKYTNLSLSTLRLRGAGRTDAGVHATGQVVAFDIPVRLLGLGLQQEREVIIGDGNCNFTSVSRSSCKDGDYHDDSSIVHSTVKSSETLSEHCIQHLREAYHTLDRHRQHSQTSNNQQNNEDSSVTATITRDKGRPLLAAADQWQIRRAIATRLPYDIVIRSVRLYTAGGIKPFEPRKDVKRKTYIYKLRFRRLSYITMQPQNNDATIIHPICNSGPHLLRRVDDQNTVWLCPWALDPEILRKSCLALVGKHDFVNFVHKDERKKRRQKVDAHVTSNGLHSHPRLPAASPVHEIDLFNFSVTCTQSEEDTNSGDGDGDDDNLEGTVVLPPVIDATFTLSAKGFQRSMVRNLVGFVVDVARGMRTLEDIPLLLLKEERISYTKEDNANNKCPLSLDSSSMVNSAPACGLCLAEVVYDHDNFV